MGEIQKRIITGITVAGFFVFSFNVDFAYYALLYIFVLIAALGTIYEFVSLASRAEEGRVFSFTLYGFSFVFLTISYLYMLVKMGKLPEGEWTDAIERLVESKTFFTGYLFVFMVMIFFRQVFFRPLVGGIYSVSTTFLMFFYITYGASHLFLLMAMGKDAIEAAFFIWYIGVINFMTDTMAYFGGKFVGNHPVGFRVSPNKTYEGYIIGVVFATLWTLLFVLLWETITGRPSPIGYGETFVLAPVFSLISVLGDLIESAFKRDAKTKDSNTLLPGHGGLFDLLDAFYLSLPAFYYYLQIQSYFD